MYEYEIRNNKTNEVEFMWGHGAEDAWRRNPKLNRNEWTIVFREYVD